MVIEALKGGGGGRKQSWNQPSRNLPFPFMTFSLKLTKSALAK